MRFDIEMLRPAHQSSFGKTLNDESFDLSLLQVIDVIEHDLVIEPLRDRRPRRGLEQLCQFYGVEAEVTKRSAMPGPPLRCSSSKSFETTPVR